MKLSLPVCDVCKTKVNRLTSEYDACTRMTTYIAHCHGSKQAVRLGDETLMNLTTIHAGVAFDTKWLENDKKLINGAK